MGELCGFPYFEAQFAKDGPIHDLNEVAAILDYINQNPVSDLLVLSHGWNNDMDDARATYRGFLQQLRIVLDKTPDIPGLAGRTMAVVGILWPSKKFAEEELIPSGAAGLDNETEKAITAQLKALKGFFGKRGANTKLDKAIKLVPRLKTDTAAATEFANLVRSLVKVGKQSDDDSSGLFFQLPADELVQALTQNTVTVNPGSGGVAAIGGSTGGTGGGAAGFFGDFLNGAKDLLNYVTYYQMKERAGVVGSTGVAELLRRIRTERPDIKLHLVGHSFGGRLVTAAATGPEGQPPLPINSLMLLQAAFSHYGFADNYEGDKDGFFRRMVTGKCVSGPVLITHTINDKAVGVAYPIASRVARQVASGLGDAADKYGGIGRNGAQKTPEASEGNLEEEGFKYTFTGGKIFNLKSDSFIKSHGDFSGPQVMHALLCSIATT
jgi:hypothetical protein